jgi:hypothetical protein
MVWPITPPPRAREGRERRMDEPVRDDSVREGLALLSLAIRNLSENVRLATRSYSDCAPRDLLLSEIETCRQGPARPGDAS